MDARARNEAITQQLSEALNETEAVLESVSVQRAGTRRFVKVILARDLAGLAPGDHTSEVLPLSLDEIGDATRVISEALDDSGAMGESPYTLEVSSPGLDRPLKSTDAFRRNVGRLVKVTLADGGTVSGRLRAAGPGGIELETDAAATSQTLALPLPEVVKGKVQVEFSRPVKEDD